MNLEKDVYTAPGAQLDVADTSGVQYAGFWVRVAAAIIDSVVQLSVVLSIVYFVYGADYWTGEPGLKGPLDVFLQFFFPLIFVIGFWKYKSATPGKMAFNCVIVNASDFQPVSTGRLVLRYFMYIVSYLFLFLGVIWVAFDSRKQGWHDKIAGTVVIFRK